MKKYLNNDEMAKFFGGYDFRTPDMLKVCKAQRELTLKEIEIKLHSQKHRDTQVEELSREICQCLIPQAYQKDTPPKTRAEDIARHLLNCGYVKIRKEE